MQPSPLKAPARSRSKLEAQVRGLGEWFHNLNLAGVQTAPHHFLGDYPMVKWRQFENSIPQDLTGRSVLDIGCNAGFYSMEMKKRGAARVLGIDSDPRYLAQARLASDVCELDIEFRQMSVFQLAELREKFDLVLFMGVLYHLRHPLLALDLVRRHVARDLLVLQTLQRGSPHVLPVEEDYPFSETKVFEEGNYPRMHFVEQRYCGDPTNWWIPNRACTEAMLRSAGFEILEHPEAEVYLCRCANHPDHEVPL